MKAQELIELLKLLNGEAPTEMMESKIYPYKIGQAYYIRTVTHHYTGRLDAVTDKELIISDAAWIADSGRWADALKSGTLSEVEPFQSGPVIINRSALVDASEWKHQLPLSQK